MVGSQQLLTAPAYVLIYFGLNFTASFIRHNCQSSLNSLFSRSCKLKYRVSKVYSLPVQAREMALAVQGSLLRLAIARTIMAAVVKR